jgi:hypothetical protein
MISGKFGSNWPSSFIWSKCEMLSTMIDGVHQQTPSDGNNQLLMLYWK